MDDDRVQEATRKANVQIVDISGLETTDSFRHDRFVALAAYYPRLLEDSRAQPDLRHAGAYLFDPVSGGLATAGNDERSGTPEGVR